MFLLITSAATGKISSRRKGPHLPQRPERGWARGGLLPRVSSSLAAARGHSRLRSGQGLRKGAGSPGTSGQSGVWPGWGLNLLGAAKVSGWVLDPREEGEQLLPQQAEGHWAAQLYLGLEATSAPAPDSRTGMEDPPPPPCAPGEQTPSLTTPSI
ncbi:hypothetical protein mRhiFer1_009717 [Rhinolophus ferrumequinum]|uniref:Uncharacterized protein n=1 Tax=Rhinolophus ferrumequinum TaxID=59479 RepID=A0A7J7ZDF5_RHIFE|nr:hypothetical protein mRhiFer1_009717 [Rhinolophus ferrumequinum]